MYATPSVHVNHIPVADPDPILDWHLFEQEQPHSANAVDDDFTDGGVSGELMSAMCSVAQFIRRGDINSARMIAERWRARIEEAREAGMQKYAGSWPRPAA